jgi:hypothetical protein
MITSIASYPLFYQNNMINSEKAASSSYTVPYSRTDNVRKIRISHENSPIRPFAPDADRKISLSCSVITEPESLLIDLSGIRNSQELAKELPTANTQYINLIPSETFEIVMSKPVFHTFEIIV